ncbi:unnamed protein product [Zymoseptoria tritici ST99CH_1A5]|uniref:F-box domain-containing protein n=1 Tax=Zymoseptoria tritici ST99CH_1A5 TaxID=1276529 RepID=A0A1Y6LXH1_ZYMTR|nr:unnamed protein product [Zymoseptoria tritici ST99CH_1A5]
MGYSEMHCTICGVSFRIGRIRTRQEPRSYAWAYFGSDKCNQLALPDIDCSSSLGCTFVDRTKPTDDFHSLDSYPKILFPPDGQLPDEAEHSKPAAEDDDITNEAVRPPAWSPAPDDEPWEASSKWMLTGMTTKTEEREVPDEGDWLPFRHGVTEFLADDYHFDNGYDFRTAMPFHPWCLEVYLRAALAQKGRVDVDGLGEWWEQSDRLGGPDEVERCMALETCQGQWWDHEKEFAFLIMDPLKDEGLMRILNEAREVEDGFDPSQSAFSERHSPRPATDEQHDPFLTLPPELLQHILTLLPTPSIGAARTVSRAFTHIPISFFHHLLRKDFPWIWEVDAATSVALPRYSKWTQKVVDDAAREPESDTFDPPDDEAGSQEDGGGSHVAQVAAAVGPAERNEGYNIPPVLPRFQTNWFKLYAALKKAGHSIPGLRNRERIWRDCGQILKKIDEMRVKDEEAAKWA